MVLIGFVGLCLLVALADMAVTQRGIRSWYPSLRHPIGTPPAWVFPVVWIPIYVVMAIAAWRIWRWNPLDRLRDASLPATPAASRPIANRLVPGRLVPGGLALRRRGLQLWGWQLGANALWTPFFFGLHRPLAALAVILSLGLLIGLTLRDFRKLDRPAGLMMAPYLVWVCYAGWLNAGIAWLNPA